MRKRIAEFRATVKELSEQRADLQASLKALVDGAKAEVRALTEEEQTQFADIEGKINAIDVTIDAEKRAQALEINYAKGTRGTANQESSKDAEIRAFASYVRSEAGVEVRSGEQNVTMGNNGAVIPTSIANMVIATVKDICPIFAKATMFHVKGTLKVPVWGLANTTHDIAVGYQTEFTDITADSGKFTSVDLTGYLAGALTLIGKSVVNSADIDVVNFIVNEMAKKIAIFLEKELLVGTSNKATGALSTTNSLTTASASVITADELITLQAKVKQAYQNKACWTMSSDTFVAVKKLKDSQNRYLLQETLTGEFPYMLLGKPVYLSDNMPAIAASAKPILYGDYEGLGVNMREDIEIQILLEKYATQHAIGVVSWFEFDSNVIDNQKLAVLTMAAS